MIIVVDIIAIIKNTIYLLKLMPVKPVKGKNGLRCLSSTINLNFLAFTPSGHFT